MYGKSIIYEFIFHLFCYEIILNSNVSLNKPTPKSKFSAQILPNLKVNNFCSQVLEGMSLLIGIYFTTDEKSNKEWIRGKLKSQFLRASGMMHSVCKTGTAAQQLKRIGKTRKRETIVKQPKTHNTGLLNTNQKCKMVLGR